jgi:hypothetical protein
MAKKGSRKKKSSKKVTSRKSSKTKAAPKKVASPKPTTTKRGSRETVQIPVPTGEPSAKVGVYGVAKMVRMFHEAGFENDLNRILGERPEDRTVKLDLEKFNQIKEFVGSKPELANHPIARELADSDCDPADPFCISFGHHSSFVG